MSESVETGENIMNTSEIIRKLCRDQKISLSELARRIGQSRQNLYKKLKRGTLTVRELQQIADTLGVLFSQSFILANGERLQADS